MSSPKRHFTAVIGNKEQGTYVSSSPSSAARKAVSNYVLITKIERLNLVFGKQPKVPKRKLMVLILDICKNWKDA